MNVTVRQGDLQTPREAGFMPVALGDQRIHHALGDVDAGVALNVQTEVVDFWLCRSSAILSIVGSSFPRVEALRKIPRHAFALK